jgi:leucyl aminopeptidase (aminopeptidase T)
LVDVIISLPGVENPEDVYKDVPQEKFAKMNKAAQAFNDLINSLKLKGGYFDYPTEFDAKNEGMDFNTYKNMIWQAINADYVKISQHAQKLEKMLKSSKKIEITTPKGTELDFSVTGRECFIADGIIDKSEALSKLLFKRWVNFPEGNITVSIIENSGNGKVFIPKSKCNFDAMSNISFKVKNGKLMDFKAEKGQDCFFNEWKEYASPKDMTGLLVIGLNPMLKVMEENADYRPSNAEGMVYVIFGDNSLHGGKNKVIGSYSAWFPISNATVKIDGKEVVKDGKLMLD